MFWKIEGIDDVDYLSVKLGVILSILIFSLFSTVNMYFLKLKTEKLLIPHYQLKTDHAVSLWERRSWNRDPNYW